MKINRKTLILTTLVCLLPIIAGALLYSRLPETVPTHFNLNGEPDGWSSRAVAAFALPAFMLVMNCVLQFALIYIVLVLSDAYAFRVDLHQFGQRVH